MSLRLKAFLLGQIFNRIVKLSFFCDVLISKVFYIYLYMVSMGFLLYVYLYLLRRNNLLTTVFGKSLARICLGTGGNVRRSVVTTNLYRTGSIKSRDSTQSSGSGSKSRRRKVTFHCQPNQHTGSFYLRVGAIGRLPVTMEAAM